MSVSIWHSLGIGAAFGIIFHNGIQKCKAERVSKIPQVLFFGNIFLPTEFSASSYFLGILFSK